MFFNKKGERLLFLTIIFFMFPPCFVGATERKHGQSAETLSDHEKICQQAESVAIKEGGEAFDQLIKLFHENKHRRAIRCIADLLSQINNDKTVDYLISTLKDDNPDIIARAAYALAVIQDKRAVEPLHDLFLDPDSKNKCNAAKAMGALRDPNSIPLLLPNLDSEYPATRSCVIRALRYYKNPEHCQRFYDIWMTDRDPMVEIDAGVAVILGNCENEITRSTQNIIEIESHFCDFFQSLLNQLVESVPKTPKKDKRAWTNNPELKKQFEDLYRNNPDESSQQQIYFLLAAISDWQHYVATHLFSAEDFGNIEENRKAHFEHILKYRKKEEIAKQFCPDLEFPDFSFWNQVIQTNSQ